MLAGSDEIKCVTEIEESDYHCVFCGGKLYFAKIVSDAGPFMCWCSKCHHFLDITYYEPEEGTEWKCEVPEPEGWKVHVFIQMLELLMDGVEVYEDFEDAKAAWEKYTEMVWADFEANPDMLAHGDYQMTDVHTVEVTPKSEQAEEGFKYNEEGRCPKCGSKELDYGVSSLPDEGGIFYPYTCKGCGFEGKEWYDLHFSEHRTD